MFQQPQEAGEKVPMAELVGSLCLIYVREVRTGIQTVYGEKEAIACDWHVLAGPHAGDSYDNALVFQGGLIGSLKGAVGGDPVLGRIGTGVAKPGQKPPFLLQPYQPQDAAVAAAWIQARQSKVQQPAGAPAAPNGAVAIDPSTLPPEVVELLRQSGQLPAA